MVWVVGPEIRKVLVFRSTTDVEEYQEEDSLHGEGVLARFEVKVSDLFVD